MTRYVELHGCSAFSFLDGASHPEEFVQAAREFEQPAVALLDRDNLSNAVRFYKESVKKGQPPIHAHIGAEITHADGSRYPLLAETRTGYQNLCRLITRMKMRSEKGKAAATRRDLEEFAEGLICLSGDERGPLAAAIAKGRGRQCLEELTGIFGPDRVYVELQRHYLREQAARNEHAVDLARSMKIPLLATNGPRYAQARQRKLLDVFTCLRHKTTIANAGRLLAPNSERYLKSSEEMERLFRDLPDAIGNTDELSKRLTFHLCDFGYELPHYPLPPGETDFSFLRKMVYERAPARFKSYNDRPYDDQVNRQLEYELAMIDKLNLAGYFLIVWEIMEFCREKKIMAQGRGSAANSAVCFALGITAVNSVKMDLLFERFLSQERGELPDIDIDLPSGEQRERAIQHLYKIYGRLGAAMTANIITYRGRSAVRDIGKVLGFDEDVLGRLSGLVPEYGWTDQEYIPRKLFVEARLDPDNPSIGKFLGLFREIQDLPRHLGQHSGGMVVCANALDSIVPLEPATMKDRVVIQWDKEDCADMRLVKIDLLGLGMMAVLEDTVTLIRDHYQEEVTLEDLSQDDPKVYQALQRADTIGLFQVESRAQMSCLPRLYPKKFYDIVVQVAIIRPGPIVGKMLNPYLRRRQGKEEPVSLHPLLDDVLERTLGVPLFQEQLLRMAMIAAGFSGGQAEELRRALGFKRSEQRMKEVEVNLRKGMEKKGIVGEAQDRIVQSITSFALYGFPESHAISFAMLAYSSAYLKCNYLAAFMAAMLNHQPMGFYHPATLVKDAQRHGLRVKPVHVNESAWLCSVEDRNTIRLGLNYVRGLNKGIGEMIACNRPYHSVDELSRRVPQLRRHQIAILASIGALNFGDDRRSALWQAAVLRRPDGELLAEVDIEDSEASPLVPMNPIERLNADLHGSRLSVGRHPVAFYREYLDQRRVIPASLLREHRNNSVVRVAGCVICRQHPPTAKGFVFLSMEDETGIANVILTPDLFKTYKQVVNGSPYLLIEGILQNLEGVVSVRAEHAEMLRLDVAHTESHDFH